MGALHIPGHVTVLFDGPVGEITDGSHSFTELYAHRCSLFVALMLNAAVPVWRAHANADGSKYEGWFLAGMELVPGTMITYHLPQHMWTWLDVDRVTTLDVGPPWDGHTSDDVIKRLATWCEAFKQAENTDEKSRAEEDAGAAGGADSGCERGELVSRDGVDTDAEAVPEGPS